MVSWEDTVLLHSILSVYCPRGIPHRQFHKAGISGALCSAHVHVRLARTRGDTLRWARSNAADLGALEQEHRMWHYHMGCVGLFRGANRKLPCRNGSLPNHRCEPGFP